MTLQMQFRRYAAALAIASTSFTAAQAQPSAAGTVSPPVRADIALSGKVLTAHNASDHLTCQRECRATAGCTGYSFNRNAKASCTLLSGALADVAVTGAVSCRMPCDPIPAKTALTPPLAAGLLRDPNAPRPVGTTRLLGSGTPLVAAAPAPDPNAKTPRTTPPPPPPPPAPPPRAAAPAVAPATGPAARTGVTGYEVVQGPEVNLAPLAYTTATAQCPAGKVALSAGYSFTVNGDSSYGIEVRGAMPEGRLANVWMRNANVFDAAKVRAIAICVNEIAGLRVVDSWTESLDDRANPSHLTCVGQEKLVGGGVMAGNDTHITANAPQPWGDPGTWLVTVIRSSPLAGQDRIRTRALCAPGSAVDGWQIIQTDPVWLDGHSYRLLMLSCPGGKVLLSGGVMQRDGPLLDMVVSSFAPMGVTSWSTLVQNRSIRGAMSQVGAVFSAVCARRQ